jgi:hypothetical protein
MAILDSLPPEQPGTGAELLPRVRAQRGDFVFPEELPHPDELEGEPGELAGLP